MSMAKQTKQLTVEEAIRSRRSIRSFRPDPVPEEFILKVLDAARLAPSGSNNQPWRFLVATDSEEKKRIRQIALDQKFLEEAGAVIVCCADLRAYSKGARSRRSQEFAQFGIYETLSGRFADPAFRARLDSLPEPDPKIVIGPATANTFIAITHMILMAEALGLGTCWVGGIGKPGEISALFGLPETVLPVALVALGYPAKVPSPRPRLSLDEILLRPLHPPATGPGPEPRGI